MDPEEAARATQETGIQGGNDAMPLGRVTYQFDCTTDQAMSFMKQFPAERLEAEPAPLPSRAKKPPKEKPLPMEHDFGDQQQLF